MAQPQFNEDKLRELILYIAEKCKDDTYFGRIKINKALFFADFGAYAELGQAITGAEYYALQHGPAPRVMLRMQQEMIRDGDVIEVEGKFDQQRLHPLRKPDLSKFSASEIAYVDMVLDAMSEVPATAVTQYTHGLLGWQAAWNRYEATKERVTIPYETVFVKNPPMDEFERVRLLGLADKHGWISKPAE